MWQWFDEGLHAGLSSRRDANATVKGGFAAHLLLFPRDTLLSLIFKIWEAEGLQTFRPT